MNNTTLARFASVSGWALALTLLAAPAVSQPGRAAAKAAPV